MSRILLFIVSINGISSLRFEWSMPPRFGPDDNGDGLVDFLPLEPGAAASPNLRVDFECHDTHPSKACENCQWNIDGMDVALFHDSSNSKADGSLCDGYFVFKEQKPHKVELVMRSETFADTVFPRDILIVGIGDSNASGEGAPEVPMADDEDMESVFHVLPIDLDPGNSTFQRVEGKPTGAKRWTELAKVGYRLVESKGVRWQPEGEGREGCHRSSKSHQALAALAIEEMDSKSTVSFVHTACSGKYVGEIIRDQLSVVREVVGNREIDAVMVSSGANDAEFDALVKACLVQKNCDKAEKLALFDLERFRSLCNLSTAPADCANSLERWSPSEAAVRMWPKSKDKLKGIFTPLANAVHGRLSSSAASSTGLVRDPSKVLFVGYPQQLRSEYGHLCYDSIPAITNDELAFLDRIKDEFNQVVEDGVHANHWTYVDVVPVTEKHGLCSEPIDDRYVDSIPEHLLRTADTAFFHANRRGHKAMSHLVTKHLFRIVFPHQRKSKAPGGIRAAVASDGENQKRIRLRLLELWVPLVALLVPTVLYAFLFIRRRSLSLSSSSAFRPSLV